MTVIPGDARVHEACPDCHRSTAVYVDGGKRWCLIRHGTCRGGGKVVSW